MKTYTHEAMLPFDALHAPLWVLDLDHATKWWGNLAAVTLWGATDREQLPADAAAARAALSGAVARFDARLRTAGGERVHSLEVRHTLDPITGKDALLVCSRDLSERLAYEQALDHGRRQLAAQADELARLAAPVLRIGSQILVLPLIGSVDRERMSVALSALLPRIVADQARTVIFDLTGAAFVDIETVESLQRALQVLKLQGCVVVVAGILPELARLLVVADARLAAPVYQTTADALRALIPRR